MSTKKRKRDKKQAASSGPRSKSPNYMVQIDEPKVLRKEVLESLREVIIFTKGFEKIVKLQQEKVGLFTNLKESVKDLKALVDTKLNRYLPEVAEPKVYKEEKKEIKAAEKSSKPVSKEEQNLNQLESQLKQIEKQLNAIN